MHREKASLPSWAIAHVAKMEDLESRILRCWAEGGAIREEVEERDREGADGAGGESGW